MRTHVQLNMYVTCARICVLMCVHIVCMRACMLVYVCVWGVWLRVSGIVRVCMCVCALLFYYVVLMCVVYVVCCSACFVVAWCVVL